MRNPTIQLGALATASALIYILAFVGRYSLIEWWSVPQQTIAKISDHDPLSAVTYLLALSALFLIYALAIRIVQRNSSAAMWRVAIAGAIAFNAILLLLYPVDAADIFDNIIHGRMQAYYGANPFYQAAIEFQPDRFFDYAAWHYYPSAYGPGWEWIAAQVARVAGDDIIANVIAFKLVGVFAYAATIALIVLTLRQYARDRALYGALFFAWNPMVLYATAGNGHNDAVMVMFIALGFYFHARKHFTAAMIALTAGALIKFIPALLLPIIVLAALKQLRAWRARVIFLLSTVAACSFLVATAYAPFWRGGDVLGLARRSDLFTTSLPALIQVTLEPSVGESFSGQLAIGTALVLLGAWIVRQMRVVWQSRDVPCRDVPWNVSTWNVSTLPHDAHLAYNPRAKQNKCGADRELPAKRFANTRFECDLDQRGQGSRKQITAPRETQHIAAAPEGRIRGRDKKRTRCNCAQQKNHTRAPRAQLFQRGEDDNRQEQRRNEFDERAGSQGNHCGREMFARVKIKSQRDKHHHDGVVMPVAGGGVQHHRVPGEEQRAVQRAIPRVLPQRQHDECNCRRVREHADQLERDDVRDNVVSRHTRDLRGNPLPTGTIGGRVIVPRRVIEKAIRLELDCRLIKWISAVIRLHASVNDIVENICGVYRVEQQQNRVECDGARNCHAPHCRARVALNDSNCERVNEKQRAQREQVRYGRQRIMVGDFGNRLLRNRPPFDQTVSPHKSEYIDKRACRGERAKLNCRITHFARKCFVVPGLECAHEIVRTNSMRAVKSKRDITEQILTIAPTRLAATP